MKSLVAYDSAYGNTANIAEAINLSLNKYGKSSVKQVTAVNESDLKGVDMLVIGSPTQGGRPTKPTQQFIDELPEELLRQSGIAIFDTRFEVSEQKLPLRILMKTIGYAATKMAKSIQQRGGNLIAEPQGFIVSDQNGPLKEGEIERAGAWAAQLANSND